MSGAFSVVRGVRIRVTKVNNCAVPVEGPRNRAVSDGVISLKYSRVDKEAEEKEQKNFNGDICAEDRTPPELKRYNVEGMLCGVDPELIALLTGCPLILDHNGNPVGFGDRKTVDSEFGAVIELWTRGAAKKDCAPPKNDLVFSRLTSGIQYGYFLIAVKEWVVGDMEVADAIMNVPVSGISMPMAGWGKGPYNVAAIDDAGTPGRLLVPIPEERHRSIFRTMVAPPPITDGCVPLDISGKFVDPDFYFGGEDDEPPADIAPEQDLTTKTLTFTGAGSAGGFELTVGTETTSTVVYNPTATQIRDAINALPSVYGAIVTGTGTGPFTIKVPGIAVPITVNSHITGGAAVLS